jgi:hypothetical protein
MRARKHQNHTEPIVLLILFVIGIVLGAKYIGYGSFDKDDPNSVRLPTVQPTAVIISSDTASKKMFRDYLDRNFKTDTISDLNTDFNSFSRNITRIINKLNDMQSFKLSEVVDGKEFALGLYDYKNKLNYKLEAETGKEEYNLGDYKYIREKQDTKFIRLLSDEDSINNNIKEQIYAITSRLSTESHNSRNAETYFAVIDSKDTYEYIYFENILSAIKLFHVIENKADKSYVFKFDNNTTDTDGYYSQKIFDINKPVKIELEFGEDFRIWPPMPQTAQDKINKIFKNLKTVKSIEYIKQSGQHQESITQYKLDLVNNREYVNHQAIMNDPYLYEYGNFVFIYVNGIDYFDTQKAGKFKRENKIRNVRDDLIEIQNSFYNALNNLSKTAEFNYRQESVQINGEMIDKYSFTFNEPEDNSQTKGLYPYTLILSVDKNNNVKEISGMNTDYGKIAYKFISFNKTLDIQAPNQ